MCQAMYTVNAGSNPVLASKLNNMNKEFIPYEQALELKELGFDEECLAYYHQDERLEVDSLGIKRNHYRGKLGVLSPLYQQAFRWFREKYEITYSIDGAKDYVTVSIDAQEYGEYGELDGAYDTYEEAELACLKKLIELVKNK